MALFFPGCTTCNRIRLVEQSNKVGCNEHLGCNILLFVALLSGNFSNTQIDLFKNMNSWGPWKNQNNVVYVRLLNTITKARQQCNYVIPLSVVKNYSINNISMQYYLQLYNFVSGCLFTDVIYILPPASCNCGKLMPSVTVADPGFGQGGAKNFFSEILPT